MNDGGIGFAMLAQGCFGTCDLLRMGFLSSAWWWWVLIYDGLAGKEMVSANWLYNALFPFYFRRKQGINLVCAVYAVVYT